jgi:hypothetical protein
VIRAGALAAPASPALSPGAVPESIEHGAIDLLPETL